MFVITVIVALAVLAPLEGQALLPPLEMVASLANQRLGFQ